jgi:flagellar hook-associated protein 1 FlgK
MLGLFGTLNLAARSMQTQMAGVEVAGQNLANVNTAGYSRQRVVIETTPTIGTSVGPEGTGAQVVRIQQIVSSLLDSQIRTQASTSGYWQAQQTGLQTAQDGLNEYLDGTGSTSSTAATSTDTSGTGLSSQLNKLFADFTNLESPPTSSPNRALLVKDAQDLASTFKQINGQLGDLRTSLNSSLGTDTDAANKLLTDVARLNGQISNAEATGGNANDLRDARTQDLQNLSQLVKVTTSTGTNGMVNISIGGQQLVADNKVSDSLQTYDAGGGQMLVKTATGGVPLTLTGGSMQGTIDARDGAIATMQTNINALASNLITAVNTVHAGGFGQTGTSGASFFNGTNASDISVNQSLADDPTKIQLSGFVDQSGDNTIAKQLAQLTSAKQTGLGNQTFTAAYAATVSGLGTALQSANTQVDNQTAVTNMLTTQRGSVSGVNVDEEMTNLISFQQAYGASASLVKTIDAMMQATLAMKV